MKKFYVFIIIISSLSTGYFVKSIAVSIQPNYRWFRISNDTSCIIQEVKIVFADRSTSATREQYTNTSFPYESEKYDSYIPVLATTNEKYHIEFLFDECSPRKGKIKKLKSGAFSDVYISKNDISYRAR